MSAHTPGPWAYVDGVVVAVPRDKIVRVKMVQDDGAVVERDHHDGLLALVYGDHDGGGYNKDANARLIAAAPDLLDALEKCADTFADFVKTFTLLQRPTVVEAARLAEEHARAALAKVAA